MEQQHPCRPEDATLADTIKVALEVWFEAFGPEVLSIAQGWINEKGTQNESNTAGTVSHLTLVLPKGKRQRNRRRV